MLGSRQTLSSATSPGFEWWWMVWGLPHNLFCFNTRLSCPSSSPEPQLNTFKSLCFFHNASISCASLASFNIAHYWNEHRKPITQAVAGVRHAPTQSHWEPDSLVRSTRMPVHSQHPLTPTPVFRLPGATQHSHRALDVHVQLIQGTLILRRCYGRAWHVWNARPGSSPSKSCSFPQWSGAQTPRIPEFKSWLR